MSAPTPGESTARERDSGTLGSGGRDVGGPDAAQTFDEHRPLLFSIAYRMLGSVMDAEDMIQEAFLRWRQALDADVAVLTPKAYLAQVVTRLCIDHLRSARVQREQYVGPWLPEPLVDQSSGFAGADPAEAVALADSLSTAFLVLLERLGPRERAIFLLREVFDYDYHEVARIVGASEANCRQIARRARQRLAEARPRYPVPPERQRGLARQFGQALGEGDVEGLLALLADDVTVYSDGGGKVAAARRPVHGAVAVATFLTGILRLAPPGLEIREATINGRPGLLTTVDGQPRNVVSLAVAGERIRAIYIMVNPDKLTHVRA